MNDAVRPAPVIHAQVGIYMAQVGIHMTPDFDPVVRCLCGQLVPLSAWAEHGPFDGLETITLRMGAMALEVQGGDAITWPGVGSLYVPYLLEGYRRLFQCSATMLVIGAMEPRRTPSWLAQDWQGRWSLTADAEVEVRFSTIIRSGLLRLER